MMNFTTVDVETANSDMGTICQIGIATFQDGKLANTWSTLINPEDYFDDINVSIHGITQDDVVNAPTFKEAFSDITAALENRICVCHTHFDRISIAKATTKYSLNPISNNWLDSARIARRTWKECAWKDYGLAKVANKIGYNFQHHDALEDAKAAGFIVLAAIEESGIGLTDWLKRVDLPIDPTKSSTGKAIQRDGNPEGPLFGERIVFTGALEIVRSEAADIASELGCAVERNVTKHTTLLVVGDQDITKLGGKEKSAKQIKAEGLIAKGKRIKIMIESDFVNLAKLK